MIGFTLRKFSTAGPCLTRVAGAGQIVGETAKFWLTDAGHRGGQPRRVSKANPDFHVEPCRSCRDHPATSYPDGYQD